MNGITKLGLALSAAVLVAGCGSDDNTSTDTPTPMPPAAESTFVRVHHSVADAPDVNVLVDGEAALTGVPFGASSEVIELDAASYSIQVDGILVDDTVATVIGPADLTFAADTRYEIFAVGKVGDETIAPLVIDNPVTDIADGNFRLQVLHAAPDAPAVDIYLTEFGADLSAEQAAATLEFTDYTPQLDVPAGDYQVRVTAAGDPSAVVFDSGAATFAAGDDLVIAAVTNTGTGDSPIQLQIADGTGAQLLSSADAGGELRIVHASADAPAVDITVNNAATPAVAGLAFLDATDFINLPGAEYLVDVAAAGGDPVVIDDAVLPLADNQRVSVYAVGALGDGSLTLAVVEDWTRRIATEAQVQLVHASPSAGAVDIYVTATADIAEATPAFENVPFNAEALVSTGYVSLMPGTYVVTVTATGTKTAAIGPIELPLAGAGVYTAVAVDATGGGLPPQLILMDDLAPAQ